MSRRLPFSPRAASRRDLIAAGLAGAALSGLPRLAAARAAPAPDPAASDLAARARDWAWLEGNWDVHHRRLRQRLAGSDQWDAFEGKSAVWLTLGGLGTIDDNLLNLPGGLYRAAGVRAYDPASGRWSIWWIDGRNPTRIDPPVTGRFDADAGLFTGADTFNGKPIEVRFEWEAIHGPRPHWRQSFSPDAGQSWEMNWENFFTRTAAAPTPLPLAAPADFAFLVGRWRVHHRKQRRRLVADSPWDEFTGSFVNWPLLGGAGNVGDNVMPAPTGAYRGIGIRTFDPATGEWLSWFLDSRDPTRLDTPLRGRFTDGVGEFITDDVHEGRPIKARAVWSRITPVSARWEQAFSVDGGRTWEVNWTSDFERIV